MLSFCSLENGHYVIPSEKTKLWEDELHTPYSQLTEQHKTYDRKEVYKVMKSLKKIKNV